MFATFIGWFNGLSLVGRTVFIVAGTSVVGAAATPSIVPSSQQAISSEKREQTLPPTTNNVIENTIVTENIPFKKITVESDTLEKGVSQVTTVGKNGVKTVTYKVTKKNGVEVSREQTSSNTTTQPTDEITTVGTYVKPTPAPRSDCDPNYTPCVPNVSYDLDCPDIGFSVRVVGSDPHRLDRDGDGFGCESY